MEHQIILCIIFGMVRNKMYRYLVFCRDGIYDLGILLGMVPNTTLI